MFEAYENEFEHAHQTGLTRGFDLGWSYKGRFDRILIKEMIEQLDPKLDKRKIQHLNEVIELLNNHKDNREFIT